MKQKKPSVWNSQRRSRLIPRRIAALVFILLLMMAGELAAQPTDGEYSGNTSQNRPFSLTVSGGNITGYSLGWACGGSSGTTIANTSCPVAGDGTFSCGTSSCSFIPFNLRTRISGTFSGQSVSGTIDLSYYPCVSGCSCCFANGLTFTASLPMPALSINDLIVAEGDSGSTVGHFEITRSYDGGDDVTVDWATSDGSATSTDYVSGSGTVTLSSGQLSKTVPVSILGDTDVEPDEFFFVDLSNPVNATISDGQGQCTITDDDGPPVVPMTMVLGIDGTNSVDGFNDPGNEVVIKHFGAGAVMTGIAWDLQLNTFGESWLSEAKLYFDGSDQDSTGLILTPASGDDSPGSGSYSSPLIDLTDNGIADIPILADGNLYIQFYEGFDDNPGSADATYLAPSFLTIEFLPSPDLIFFDGFESGDISKWSSDFP